MTHPHLFLFQIKELRKAMKTFWHTEIEKWLLIFLREKGAELQSTFANLRPREELQCGNFKFKALENL